MSRDPSVSLVYTYREKLKNFQQILFLLGIGVPTKKIWGAIKFCPNFVTFAQIMIYSTLRIGQKIV